MSLCIDARMISSGGIGTLLKNLIPKISNSFLQTKLIMHPDSANRELWAGEYQLCKAPIYSLREQWALPRCISACDIFWSPHYNVPVFPIRAKKRIVTIHDACHLALRHSLRWKERIYAQKMLQQAFRCSDLILTDSFFSQKELCKYLSVAPSKIQVIYPGVDFERFAKKKPTDSIRKKYSLPSSFFLFVGNIKPHKNLRLILEAYEYFSPDLPLVIVGKIKHLINPDSLIEKVFKKKERMFFVEEVPDQDLSAFYQMATALLFPSLYEGFGLPPLEAMSASCPVIVSNRASLPEICGDAAYFIDPMRPEELARAMFEVASDFSLQEKLKRKGQEQARRFSWDRAANEYINAFQFLINP